MKCENHMSLSQVRKVNFVLFLLGILLMFIFYNQKDAFNRSFPMFMLLFCFSMGVNWIFGMRWPLKKVEGGLE